MLRRYRAAGLDSRAVIGSQIALGAVLGTVASAVVLVIGGLLYGVPTPDDPLAVVAWFVAGLLCFIAIGGALGAVMPSSRGGHRLRQPAVRSDVPPRRWWPAAR